MFTYSPDLNQSRPTVNKAIMDILDGMTANKTNEPIKIEKSLEPPVYIIHEEFNVPERSPVAGCVHEFTRGELYEGTPIMTIQTGKINTSTSKI